MSSVAPALLITCLSVHPCCFKRYPLALERGIASLKRFDTRHSCSFMFSSSTALPSTFNSHHDNVVGLDHRALDRSTVGSQKAFWKGSLVLSVHYMCNGAFR